MISGFRGPYQFLSNFFIAPITLDDHIVYPTAEHAYQAHKTHLLHARQCIASLTTPGQAKREGRKLIIRDDWEQIKGDVMREILHKKFDTHPFLAHLLLETEDEELVETNMWHDQYWGSCECSKHVSSPGMNLLGIILMHIRETIRPSQSSYETLMRNAMNTINVLVPPT